MTTTLRRLILGATATAMLTTTLACAPTIYVHPTKDQRGFAHDSVQCQALARQAAGYDPYGISGTRLYQQCMYGEGWSVAR